MKREDITAIFPDATEAQITAVLNANGAEVKSWKDKHDELKNGPTVEQLQAEQQKVSSLEKELSDLKKANAVRQIREKVAGDKGIPVNLLTGDTEEACTAQADAILAFAQPSGYPVLKDGGTPPDATGADNADWLSVSEKISAR